MPALQWRPRAGQMRDGGGEAFGGQDLETLDHVARRLQPAEQRQPGGGIGQPDQAVARAAIAGASRSAAAVTTPSVPSAPISNCPRS